MKTNYEQTIRDFYGNLITSGCERMAEDFWKLPPRARWQLMLSMTEFVCGKKKSVEVSDVSQAQNAMEILKAEMTYD